MELKELVNLSILGYGSCGQVYKMEHVSSKTELAVKIMHRTASDEENKRIIMDLDVIIKSYNFPYIVRCLGYFINSVSVKKSSFFVLVIEIVFQLLNLVGCLDMYGINGIMF